MWNRHPACSILAFLEMSICEPDLFLTNREGAKSAKKEEEEGLRGEYDPFDAFFEDGNVEVDEKAQAVFGHFKIRDNLGFVDGS